MTDTSAGVAGSVERVVGQTAHRLRNHPDPVLWTRAIKIASPRGGVRIGVL